MQAWEEGERSWSSTSALQTSQTRSQQTVGALAAATGMAGHRAPCGSCFQDASICRRGCAAAPVTGPSISYLFLFEAKYKVSSLIRLAAFYLL